MPRNKYAEIGPENPTSKEQAVRPEEFWSKLCGGWNGLEESGRYNGVQMIRTARTLSVALALLAGTAATAACAPETAAQPAQQPDAPFTVAPLGHGISAAIDNPAAKANRSGSNAGFLIGPNAVAVVDTFES